MVSLQETPQSPPPAPPKSAGEPIISSPRISFSADFLDETNFISICPSRENPDHNFEFLSGISTNMMAADELFREGKLLPFRQAPPPSEKPRRVAVRAPDSAGPDRHHPDADDGRRMSWFLDDDPSPRPPKCTVLWKELLRLKKQRASTLSPSLSSSSSSSSSGGSLPENPSGEDRKKGVGNREKIVNRVKRGIERTRSASIKIRPIVNVPICAHGRTSSGSLPPLFPFRRREI